MKSEKRWTHVEDKDTLVNSRALNSIYNRVDKNFFKIINTCTSTKDAWLNLEVAHEGTSKVWISKFQLFTTKFENLMMLGDENINEFNVGLHEIANNSLAIGEKMSDKKLVKKLRYLPKRFDMKVTTFKEAQIYPQQKLMN